MKRDYYLKIDKTYYGMPGGRQFSMEQKEIGDYTKLLKGCFGEVTQKGKGRGQNRLD